MKELEKNKIQLAAVSISKLTKDNKELQLFDFPFLFENIENVQKIYNKIFNEKDSILYNDKNGKENKYVVLGLWHNEMKQVYYSLKKIIKIQ